MSEGGHQWEKHFFSKFTWCAVCNDFIWGVTKQSQKALKCSICKAGRHKACSATRIQCPGHVIEDIGTKKMSSDDHRQFLEKYSAGVSSSPSDVIQTQPTVTNVTTPEPTSTIAVALYDFEAMTDRELELTAGDRITIIEENGEWVLGRVGDKTGFFPISYVRFE
eukprot:TRINITY_DN2365_c0_g1_i1.p1 TRINITY_DN2365_c0_g1~~TRINITY_DN2365_c0_g1_i1.p1  ORF type:complete len:173 (+),score=39.13 TRINITY_DN2365_c0_g1_i1:27-521(+)